MHPRFKGICPCMPYIQCFYDTKFFSPIIIHLPNEHTLSLPNTMAPSSLTLIYIFTMFYLFLNFILASFPSLNNVSILNTISHSHTIPVTFRICLPRGWLEIWPDIITCTFFTKPSYTIMFVILCTIITLMLVILLLWMMFLSIEI